MTTKIENIIGNQATTGHSVLLGYRVVNERGDEIGTASNYDQAEHIARCYEMKKRYGGDTPDAAEKAGEQ